MLQRDDLKNTVRAPSIKSTRKEDNKQESEQEEETDLVPTSGKSSLFAVPENRKFASRFVRVRPLGNPINRPRPVPAKVELPTTVKSSPPTTSSTTPRPIIVTELPPEMSLSGQEAEDLFNSLFPTIGEAGDAIAISAPVSTPATIPSREPTTTESITTTTTEKVEELPRNTLFSRPRGKLRLRISKPKLIEPSNKDESGSDDNKEDIEQERPFPFRNRFRGKNSFINKKLSQSTTTSSREEEITTLRPEPVTRRTNRFSFVPTPVTIEEDIEEDISDNLIESSSAVETPSATPRSLKKLFPRKSFRALIQSNRNILK